MSVDIQLKDFATKANPISADIFYVGDSANSFDEVQCTIASIAAAAGSTTPTANTLPLWDSNSNLSANNFLPGYTTTATAASTTTLTVASTYFQFFTGSTTQTVKMPVVTTLVLGQPWIIVNNSSGNVTVQSSGANTIATMTANTSLMIICILITGTTAASWQVLNFA